MVTPSRTARRRRQRKRADRHWNAGSWWKGFNDAKLDGLVDRAIVHNHDLRIATANLKEARALRRLTTFDLAPTVQANAGYTNSL